VGWIFDKEWLAYTVDVKPGVYDLLVRVATPVDTKKMNVSLDGKLLVTVKIPNTGGYSKWQTLTIKGVKVPSGKVLKWESIVKSKEEFDINWIEFVPAR